MSKFFISFYLDFEQYICFAHTFIYLVLLKCTNLLDATVNPEVSFLLIYFVAKASVTSCLLSGDGY